MRVVDYGARARARVKFLKSINAIIVYIVITKNEMEKKRRLE